MYSYITIMISNTQKCDSTYVICEWLFYSRTCHFIMFRILVVSCNLFNFHDNTHTFNGIRILGFFTYQDDYIYPDCFFTI